MTTILHLLPGDYLTIDSPVGPTGGTFIAAIPHPKHQGLALVVWVLDDGTFSLDALDWQQVPVGRIDAQTVTERGERLIELLRGKAVHS